MKRNARIALSLGLVLCGSAIAPFLVFGFKAWLFSDWLRVSGLGCALLMPAWLLLLPMVLRFDRFSLGRASVFVLTCVMACSIVLIGETIYFFTHSPNALPSHGWFLHEFGWIAATSAALCLVYVAIVGSASSHLSANMQPAR